MSIFTEQKIAKVIELLEQYRRNDPNQPDRLDPDAQAMAEPVSPVAVSQALDEGARRGYCGGLASRQRSELVVLRVTSRAQLRDKT